MDTQIYKFAPRLGLNRQELESIIPSLLETSKAAHGIMLQTFIQKAATVISISTTGLCQQSCMARTDADKKTEGTAEGRGRCERPSAPSSLELSGL